MMSPLIFIMLKIIQYARKQDCFVVFPVIFSWQAGGWNSRQHRVNITPVFLFQSNSEGPVVCFFSVVLTFMNILCPREVKCVDLVIFIFSFSASGSVKDTFVGARNGQYRLLKIVIDNG